MPIITNPRSQIRLGAITGSIADISLLADDSIAKAAGTISADNLEKVLGEMAGAIKRIHGATTFTEQGAGIFSHETSVFSGSVSLKDSSGVEKISMSDLGVVSASSDILAGRDLLVAGDSVVSGNIDVVGTSHVGGVATFDSAITGSAGLKLTGDLDVNSTADFQGAVQMQSTLNVDALATLSGALVEDLNVADGIVYTDASGRLNNDANFKWDGNKLTITGSIDITGGFVGSSLSPGQVVFVDQNGGLATESVLAYDASTDKLSVGGSVEIGGGYAGGSGTTIDTTGNLSTNGILKVDGAVSGSVAKFTGEVHAANVKVDALTQPGVVIAGANGLLTTTASLFYSENRLEVSSSVRVSGDMAVDGEGGIADITSIATTAAIFDAGVNTIYMGADAELIMMGEQGGMVDFAGDVRLTGSISMAGTAAEFIDRVDGGSLTIRGGDLTGSVGKVAIELSASNLMFRDGYKTGAGFGDDLSLAKSIEDWQRFRNIFGEVSILSAISTAAALPTDAKYMYKVTTDISEPAHVASELLTQAPGSSGNAFSGSFVAVPMASRNENIDVFLNGQLLVSKSYDATNYDYDIAHDGVHIVFNFPLQQDDFISVLVPQTVASIASWVSGSGTGGGGTGGGGGASALEELTDVAVSLPMQHQVLAFEDGNWINRHAAYDIAGSVAGRPASNEVVFKMPMSRPASFVSGSAYCETAPTLAVTMSIEKGTYSGGSVTYSSLGSIIFDSAAISGSVFISGTLPMFDEGDILRVKAPASQDATFAGPMFTLYGLEE